MSRFNTGNPIGSADPRDRDDNSKNLDEAINSGSFTFVDRRGQRRLTLKGYENAAGSGDVAIQAAAAALADADRAEQQADRAEQQADRAEQDVSHGIATGVSQVTNLATSAANRAESARDAAITNGSIYASPSTGQSDASLVEGDYFWSLPGSGKGALSLWQKGATEPSFTGRSMESAHEARARDSLAVSALSQADTSPNLITPALYSCSELPSRPTGATSWPSTLGLYGGKKVVSFESDGGGLGFSFGYKVAIAKLEDTASFSFVLEHSDATIQSGVNSRFSIVALDSAGYYLSQEEVTFQQAFGFSTQAVSSPIVCTLQGKDIAALKSQDGAVHIEFRAIINVFPVVAGHKIHVHSPCIANGNTLGFRAHKDPVENIVNARLALYSPKQIVPSTNLYDPEAATVGYVVLSDGTVVEDSGYSVTGFIAVEPGQHYAITAYSDFAQDYYRGFNALSFFDVDKTFLNRVPVDNTAYASGVRVITVPENARYIRLNMQDTIPDRYYRQINKGTAALDYEDHIATLTGVKVADDVLDRIERSLPADAIMLDLPVDGTFNTDQVWDSYYTGPTGFSQWGDITATGVYAMFDALQAQHPDYITKQYLGDDLFGNAISVYKFIPSKPSASVSTRYPKAFITCAVHGYEHVPPLAMYLLLEQMCNNWQSDALLEALRFNLDLIIIPVANPSGFDDYTRKNRNGVDINRNFPEGFGWQSMDPESPYYGGPEPLSELEAQYISQVMDEHPDIDMCYDFHNFHGTSAETHPHYIWVPTGGTPYVQHMTQMLVSRMTRKWQAEFNWLPQGHDYHAGYASGTAGAMVQDHALARGIAFSATFEVCERWWLGNGIVSTYDETHCKTAVEAIANWLLINLRELSR